MAGAAERVTAPAKRTGLPTGTWAGAAKLRTVPAQRPSLSTEMPGLLADTPNPAVRAASARAPSAAMTMADKKEAFRHAAAPASVVVEGFMAAEGFTAVAAGVGNRTFVMFLADREIQKWREPICGE